jgi:hypothetical protein
VNERWRRIKELYQEALARDVESRTAYLSEAFAGRYRSENTTPSEPD